MSTATYLNQNKIQMYLLKKSVLLSSFRDLKHHYFIKVDDGILKTDLKTYTISMDLLVKHIFNTILYRLLQIPF